MFPSQEPTVKLNKASLQGQMHEIMLSFCAYARQAGVDVKPWRGGGLTQFNSLSYSRQREIYGIFRSYYDIFASSKEENISIRDDKQIFWWALKRMKLRPVSDLFDHIEEGDIVEVYDRFGTQLFRNFAFFSVCSYTLDEIFSSNWMELFWRDERDFHEVYAVAQLTLDSRELKTRPVGMVQEIREVRSERLNIIEADHKYISPLRGPEGNQAFVLISRAKIIGRQPQAAK